MDERFEFSDYFDILVWVLEIVGLFSLSLGPFVVSIILAFNINVLFLLLLLVYLPLAPLLFILWDKFIHQVDD